MSSKIVTSFQRDSHWTNMSRNATLRLKNTAWKLRKLHNQQTAIDFNGHLLTLKHKQKDSAGAKYSWTIFSEWAPEPTDSVVPQTTRTGTAEGLLPTPILTLDTDSTLVIKGLKADNDMNEEGIKTNFLTILGDDASKVDSVRLVGRMIVVKCQTKEACKELKGKHGSKSLLGSTMTWSLESEV